MPTCEGNTDPTLLAEVLLYLPAALTRLPELHRLALMTVWCRPGVILVEGRVLLPLPKVNITNDCGVRLDLHGLQQIHLLPRARHKDKGDTAERDGVCVRERAQVCVDVYCCSMAWEGG